MTHDDEIDVPARCQGLPTLREGENNDARMLEQLEELKRQDFKRS